MVVQYHSVRGLFDPYKWIHDTFNEKLFTSKSIVDDISDDPSSFLLSYSKTIQLVPQDAFIDDSVTVDNEVDQRVFYRYVLAYLMLLLSSNDNAKQQWNEERKLAFHDPVQRRCSVEIDQLTFLVQRISCNQYKGNFPGRLIFRHDMKYKVLNDEEDDEEEEYILRFTIGYRTI